MAKDYYGILGVGKGASQEEIKAAFRKLAHQHHPDKTGGSADKFKEINEAYQVLGNAEKRKQYDQFGSSYESFGQGGGSGGFNWEDIMRQAGGGQGGANFDFGDFDLGDIFGSAFGFGGGKRASRSTGPQRGEDLQAEMELTFEDSVRGAKRTITLQRQRKCEHCSGNSAEPGSKIITCETCKGSGQQVHAQRTPFGVFQTRTACRTCGGQGQTFEKPCKACDGRGLSSQRAQLDLNIPAGIDHGETLRVTGEGEGGFRGGPAGDLYVKVRIRPSKIFMRQGYDIITKQMVPFTVVALGGDVQVETVDGPTTLQVPAGTQTGTVLKLKGVGVPRLHGRGRGDHLVEIVVQTPASLSKKAKGLLEELKNEL